MERLGVVVVIASLATCFFVYEPKSRDYILGGASVGAGILLGYVIFLGVGGGKVPPTTEQNQRFSKVVVRKKRRTYEVE